MDNPYYEKLVNAALRFVSYRPRSQKELTAFLAKKLTRWKVSGTLLVTKVVERMRELGYVNDAAFASWWIDQRTSFRPKGRRAIEAELRKKGIESNVHFDEVPAAKKALVKKRMLWAKLPIIEQKKKTYTFLAQRGFSSETIGKIIDEIARLDYN